MTDLTQFFRVTLEQDVVMSATNATTDMTNHLDYLPGNNFLGIAAQRLYDEFTAEQQWQVFHSGAVSFGDGLPLGPSDLLSYPVPLSLHHYKGETFVQQDRLIAEQLFDPSQFQTDPTRQPVQLRGGHFTADGQSLTIKTQFRMKTAINPVTARAYSGQLFGYSSLQAGQRFGFHLTTSHLNPDVFAQLVKGLTGIAHVGRSRSAQYGRVRIEPMDSPPALSHTPAKNLVTFWLLSDLALDDERGQPTAWPRPSDVGLPESAEWRTDRSFIRTRRYSPFNAKRQAHDPMRQLIVRGSVLRFSCPEGTALTSGVQQWGKYREGGLGVMVCNPTLLSTAHPQFLPSSPFQTPASLSEPSQPRSFATLLTLLDRRVTGLKERETAEESARKVYDELVKLMRAARAWNGLRDDQPFPSAPNRSQWGQIKELANQHRTDAVGLWADLFTRDTAVIRKRSGWELEIGPNSFLYQAVPEIEVLKSHQNNPLLPEIIGRLAAWGLTEDWRYVIEGRPERKQETVK